MQFLHADWESYKAFSVARDTELSELLCGNKEVGRSLLRYYALSDRFFLMEKLLRATHWIKDISDSKRKYIYEFVRAAELDPWGYIDLAARFHCKSMALTYAGLIQYVLNNPEKTIGIFSFKGQLAKSFLLQIKQEFEINSELKLLFPDILYENPSKESPKWSENEGIVVKRKGNPKELTIESVGLVDSQRTGMHYNLLWFDDAIEKTAAGSPYMMEKTEEAMRLAIGGLGTHDKVYGGAGTRWRVQDAYENLASSGVFKLRKTNCTTDNTRSGEPLYMTADEMAETQKQFTIYQFSCQMLNEPVADSAKKFKLEWLQFYDYAELGRWQNSNRYILVDPANSKKKDSDYTAMVVIGLGLDGNYHVYDIVHARLNMFERVDRLFELVQKWKPKAVGYEKYGMIGDLEAIERKKKEEMFFFPVVELGGKMAKEDRIEKLMPIAQQKKLFLPKFLPHPNYEHEAGVIDYFIHWEYLAFPFGQHDDLLDAMARIVDPQLDAVFPAGVSTQEKKKDYIFKKRVESVRSWLSA